MAKNNISLIKEQITKCKPTKKHPIYDSHIYWSQKAFNVTDILIQGLSSEGDTIFDPFMGSGVTVFEAVLDSAKRNAIGVDINEVPVFIVNTLLSTQNHKKSIQLIKEFVSEAHRKFDFAYTTSIDGQIGQISTVLFDIHDSKFVLKTIKGRLSNGDKFSKDPDAEDLKKIMFRTQVKNINDYVLLEDSKLAVRKGEHISEIFTPRNFTVLDGLIGLLNETKYHDAYDLLRYIILSMIHLCKITDTHSNSQWPLWIPTKDCVEKNALLILDRRSKLTIKALEYQKKHYKKVNTQIAAQRFMGTSNYCLLQKGIQDVSIDDIPNNSVDLIITDPPYLGQVAYSEYMQLYEPFLGFNINFKDEIVVSSSPKRKKDTDNYYELMDSAFNVCAKKLKKGHYFCMYFHDCKLGVWDNLISMLSKNGFRFLTQVHIEKSLTVKNIISPKKSLNGDALLFFVKENVVKKEHQGQETLEEILMNVVSEAKHMIIEGGGALSTPELYDNGLMEFIIHNGWLHPLAEKFSSLVSVFENFFVWNEKLGKWTLS